MFFVDKNSGLYSSENHYGDNGVEVDADISSAGGYSITDDGRVVLSVDHVNGLTRGLIRYEP